MRKSARTPLAIAALSATALGAATLRNFTPFLVWNASASAPIGLYSIAKRAPEIGDFVLVEPSAELQQFIAERGYLPPNIPLLKRVAALHGAEICRTGQAVSIDGMLVAEALEADSFGLKMPVWSGCFVVESGAVFLLNDNTKSLDGRYFGAMKTSQIIGVATPIFLLKAPTHDASGAAVALDANRHAPQPRN